MTHQQLGDLYQYVRLNRGRCLDIGDMLDEWLTKNPTADRATARRLVGARAPFPSIAGSPPVYRDRPYYNARQFEALDNIIDRDDMV